MCHRRVSPKSTERRVGWPVAYPLGCFPILRLDDHRVLAAQIRLTTGQPLAPPQRDEAARVEVSERAAGNRRAVAELADVLQTEQVGIELCARAKSETGVWPERYLEGRYGLLNAWRDLSHDS